MIPIPGIRIDFTIHEMMPRKTVRRKMILRLLNDQLSGFRMGSGFEFIQVHS
jgi:hypothetical protein